MIGVHPLGKVSEFRQNVNPMETKSRGKLLHEVLKERKALPECPISGEESREGGSGKRGRQEGCPRQEREVHGGLRSEQGQTRTAKCHPLKDSRSILQAD